MGTFIIIVILICIIIMLSTIDNNSRDTHAEAKAIRNKLDRMESEQQGIRRLLRQNMSTQQVIPRKADEKVIPFTDK